MHTSGNQRYASATVLCLALAVLLPLPGYLRTTWPTALRCDPAGIQGLFMAKASCIAAASGSSCVCLPIAQSFGYTVLPIWLQAIILGLAAVLWTMIARGPRRLWRLNAAVIVAVLADAALLSTPGGWALLNLLYAPLVALAAALVATVCSVVTAGVIAHRSRGSATLQP